MGRIVHFLLNFESTPTLFCNSYVNNFRSGTDLISQLILLLLFLYFLLLGRQSSK